MYVFNFIKLSRRSKCPVSQQACSHDEFSTARDIDAAPVYWLRDSQSTIRYSSRKTSISGLELCESHRYPGLAKGVVRTVSCWRYCHHRWRCSPQRLIEVEQGWVSSLKLMATREVPLLEYYWLLSGQSTAILKRPVQRLYPLEIQAETNQMASTPPDTSRLTTDSENPVDPSEGNTSAELVPQQSAREKCKAFIRAQGNLKQWVDELNMYWIVLIMAWSVHLVWHVL